MFNQFESGSGNLALEGFEAPWSRRGVFPRMLNSRPSSARRGPGAAGDRVSAARCRRTPLYCALRRLWPLDVEDIAILRNDSANPDLDPQRMTLHDRTYIPSVGKDTQRRRAGSRGRCSPTSPSTKAARRPRHGRRRRAYVPLRGLRHSGAKPAAVANPEVTGVEGHCGSGLATVGLGTALGLASVIFKGG